MILERILSVHAQEQNQQTSACFGIGDRDLGAATASLVLLSPSESPTCTCYPEHQICRVSLGPLKGYLVSGLKAFHFPSYVLHKLWVEEFWATFMIWLEEGECNPYSCCSRLRVLMLLCSPNLLFPGLLQKHRIQRTWERGELDPVGLRHGYQKVLVDVTAWLLLTLKRRARSNQDFSCSVIQI